MALAIYQTFANGIKNRANNFTYIKIYKKQVKQLIT